MILERIAQMRTGDRRGALNLLRPPSGLPLYRPVATSPTSIALTGFQERLGNGDQ